jgi:hypothetical protein
MPNESDVLMVVVVLLRFVSVMPLPGMRWIRSKKRSLESMVGGKGAVLKWVPWGEKR